MNEELMRRCEEKFGKGTMMTASSKKLIQVKEWAPTGSLTLDLATGGGVPKGGKCTCILGKESASKTTLLLHIIAEDQRKGNLCAFLDAENTLDLEYAEALGVDLDKLHIIDREAYLKSMGIKPKDRDIVSGEEWFELVCKLLKSNIYGIVGLDSVASLVPMAEIQAGITGGRLAGVAGMMSKAYRAVNNALAVSDSGFVYLNQYRMDPGKYGNPLVEPGGEAFKYLQALKLEISKSLDKDADGAYGIVVKGKVTKSKVCVPHKEFEYYVEFGKGIVPRYEIMNTAIDLEIITKAGNTYSYQDTKLGVGVGQLEKMLEDNPDILDAVKHEVIDRITGTKHPVYD
jgi:recombination protein RecA